MTTRLSLLELCIRNTGKTMTSPRGIPSTVRTIGYQPAGIKKYWKEER